MAKITIKNLRHVKELEFDIPKVGVWLLTGSNGTGKTSLLGCLRRIGTKNAFPVHFPTSKKSERLDSNEGASIEYETPNGTVNYVYKNDRWQPTPKSLSTALNSLGYPIVKYIAADAKRIEPRKEDFAPNKVKQESKSIIDAANRIFTTNKFNALKTINVRRGVGSLAFLLELPTPPKQPKRYFSERNLSLGELCILKLLRELDGCKNGSLILIDEIELALHPTAQAELLSYLQEISISKSLTIVVSTHSATLIKQAPRNRILFLETEPNGKTLCTRNCYQSYILGQLSYQEESASDVIIYVEDDSARIITEQLSQKFIAAEIGSQNLTPSVSVIPIGGFVNVLRFYVRQKKLLPAITKAFVVLDADAEDSLNKAQVPDIIQIYKSESRAISFLPFTPEVGLCTYLFTEQNSIIKSLRKYYSSNTIQIRSLNNLTSAPNPSTPGIRDICKGIVTTLCEEISNQLPNASSTDVKHTLLKMLAEHTFTQKRAAVMKQFGSILR